MDLLFEIPIPMLSFDISLWIGAVNASWWRKSTTNVEAIGEFRSGRRETWGEEKAKMFVSERSEHSFQVFGSRLLFIYLFL